MGFLTPWFLAGVAAVGLPVWLHLLRKHKTTPLPFSSLMFFEKRTQSSIKHRRLRYLLLFALRSALIALLVLAFAHPYVTQKILPTKRSDGVTVLAIDNSLSMRSGAKLEEAKRAARAVVAGLRTGERAQVVAFGQRVHVMSEVTDDHSPLNAGIDAIQPGDSRTSYGELSRSLRSLATAIKVPLHVYLYSDMQQTGMPPNFNDLRLAADIVMEPKAVASGSTPNFAVENVVAPRRVYDSKKTRVLVTVAGFGTKKSNHNVTLTLNGRTVETKAAEIPDSGRATVEFLSLDVPYGRNKGEVRIDSGDALPADDTFYFSVERADPRRALFVRGAENLAMLYFKTALEASGQTAYEIDGATVDQTANLSPSKYAFVVLSDVAALPGTFENELKNYVKSGGSVLAILGPNTVKRGRVPVSDDKVEGSNYSGREGAMYQTAAWLDPSHPSIQKNDRWDEVKFHQSIRVTAPNARVAGRLSDQTPLLLDQQIGSGRVLTFTSTIDDIANDFPKKNAFVPFVEQTARYLGHLDSGPSSVPVGSFAELRDTKETGSAVDVVDPKGNRALSLAEAAKAQNIQFEQAGVWEIRRPNGRNELLAVNADRHESDLAPMAAETLALWQNTAIGSAAPAAGGPGQPDQKPLSLWWYVMLIVLLLSLAESLLGNQHLSVDKEAA
jgi:hypothetical protein